MVFHNKSWWSFIDRVIAVEKKKQFESDIKISTPFSLALSLVKSSQVLYNKSAQILFYFLFF